MKNATYHLLGEPETTLDTEVQHRSFPPNFQPQISSRPLGWPQCQSSECAGTNSPDSGADEQTGGLLQWMHGRCNGV